MLTVLKESVGFVFQRLRSWDRRMRRKRKWRKAENWEPLLLLPDALHVRSEPRLRFAVLGNCFADRLVEAAVFRHEAADHYFLKSSSHEDPPNAPWGDYDAVIVDFSLRSVLAEVSQHSQDVFHCLPLTDEHYAQMMDLAGGNLRSLADRIQAAVGGKAPVFFLAFLEPPCAYQGTLLNNRRKSLYHTVRTLNDILSAHLEDLPNAHYIETNDLVRYLGDSKITDAYTANFTHTGLSGLPEQFRFPASVIKRITHAMMTLRHDAPVKLIITDLDNTLWKGVLAELDEIVPMEHTEGWPLGYVEALLEFKRRGGLLAISSKNDEVPTLERMRRVWGNRLDPSMFCSVKINWEPKSRNIRAILQETNLLPSNALFIDDNPREIAEVSRVLPEIRTLTGEPTVWRQVILFSPHTQVVRISQESTGRTEAIHAKIQRDQMAEKMDRGDYLRSLGIKATVVVIESVGHARYARAVELINKTNQFNTTGMRWSPSDFQALFAGGGRIVTLSASDRFGDNGLIAAAIVRGPTIEQVVLSCRVFALGLETALLSSVVADILTAGERSAIASFQPTPKNATCSNYFRDHGFLEDGAVWRTNRIPERPDWIALVE